MTRPAGRHFLQIPGPTNVPDEVLRAIDAPTMDHRSEMFAEMVIKILSDIRPLFGTTSPVVIYPASGTGAWEAALMNTLSPGDEVLCFETGHFATLWSEMATRLGLTVRMQPGNWRHGVDPEAVTRELSADTRHRIRALMVVHNETSTGVTSRVPEIRAAIDAAGHPTLLLVDTISSLGSVDYQHDGWGVDVTVAGSQKGMMLPPGLSFNAISDRALDAHTTARSPRSYWDWSAILAANARGYFPYTPSTNLLYGLRKALDLLSEEGMSNVFARHRRHAEATRRAVQGWGLEILAKDPREYSNTLTAVVVPEPYDADAVRATILKKYDMSLGAGLGKLSGRIFRIGHLGWTNDLTIAGTLAGVQMGMKLAGLPVAERGLGEALAYLQT